MLKNNFLSDCEGHGALGQESEQTERKLQGQLPAHQSGGEEGGGGSRCWLHAL